MGILIVILGFVSFCLFSELFEGANYRTSSYLGSLTLSAFGVFFAFLYSVHHVIEHGASDLFVSYCLVVIIVLSIAYHKLKHHFHA